MGDSFEELSADLLDFDVPESEDLNNEGGTDNTPPEGELPPDGGKPEDQKIEGEPSKDEPGKGEPDKDAPAKDEPAKDEPVVDERDTIIEQLRQTIAEMAQNKDAIWPKPDTPPADGKVETPAEKKDSPVAPANAGKIISDMLSDVQYFTEEELDKILDEPELINQAINKSRREMAQALVTALPSMIQDTVNRQIMVAQAVTSFYEANKDLVPHADYVRFVMGQIEDKNPDKTYAEIFNDTAAECRKRLGLKDPSVVIPEKGKSKGEESPAFAGSKKGSTKRPTDTKNDLFDENARDLLDL